MPSFVVIISLLSLLSFLYAVKIFNQEIRRMQFMTSTYGGTLERMTEQLLRLTIATLLTMMSLATVLMSVALMWLAAQPSMFG